MFNFRIIGVIVALVSIIGFISTSIGYYIYSIDKIEKKLFDEIRLKQNIQDLEKTIAQQKIDNELQNVVLKQVERQYANAKANKASLEQRFKKLENGVVTRDIGSLAKAKPNLIEKIIDGASDKTIRCFEIASGSELTPEEWNAQKLSQINTECPQLANPNYKSEQ